jgi:hypothetical protein
VPIRNAKLGKQQAREQRAGYADQDVADDAKAGAVHDLAGQPAGHQADEENDEYAFVGNLHLKSPRGSRRVVARRRLTA